MILFVSGLPDDLDDAELMEIFGAYGKVRSTTVILDRETRKSQCFGFVDMPDKTEAENTIRRLDEAELEGKTMTVKKALYNGKNRAPNPNANPPVK
jgi:cold-inducible RNA-binding protein